MKVDASGVGAPQVGHDWRTHRGKRGGANTASREIWEEIGLRNVEIGPPMSGDLPQVPLIIALE